MNNNTELKVMQNDIKHINGNVDEIKQYIKEDREWKTKLFTKIDSKYAKKDEVSILRKILHNSIYVGVTSLITFLGIIITYFLSA